MARKVKDRFRDWNLLHKATIAVIAAFFISVLFRAVLVIDAGFEMEEEIILPYDTTTIWPWVYSMERRSDWQGELVDLVKYTGDAAKTNSTRLLYWKRGYRRWQAVEQTTEVVQERLYATIQESDIDQRWFRVELTPTGPCETKVRLYEIIRPKDYEARFWFFTRRGEAADRLAISLGALDRWLGDSAPACTAGDHAG